jgi:formylglycine-generating enzyme
MKMKKYILLVIITTMLFTGCKKDGDITGNTGYSVPNLWSPANQAISRPLTIDFSWSPVNGAAKYQLRISTDNAFALKFFNDSMLTTTTQQVSGFTFYTTYYWRVRAKSGGKWTEYSDTHTFKTVPFSMIPIPAGTFVMGDPYGEGERNEHPIHQVTLSSFLISSTEVSQQMYQMFTGKNPSTFQGTLYPVHMVSWYDAIDYCNKLSIAEGLTPCYSINGNTAPGSWSSGTIEMSKSGGYRLPTEAEWEYAASAGGNKYSGTISAAEASNYAWYYTEPQSSIHQVGIKLPNSYGLYDMCGNITEWCWDWYGSYTADAQTNPAGAASGTLRVAKGGAWYSAIELCRIYYRYFYTPDTTNQFVGFRVARDK